MRRKVVFVFSFLALLFLFIVFPVLVYKNVSLCNNFLCRFGESEMKVISCIAPSDIVKIGRYPNVAVEEVITVGKTDQSNRSFGIYATVLRSTDGGDGSLLVKSNTDQTFSVNMDGVKVYLANTNYPSKKRIAELMREYGTNKGLLGVDSLVKISWELKGSDVLESTRKIPDEILNSKPSSLLIIKFGSINE